MERRLTLLAIALAALLPARVVRSDRVLCPIRRVTGHPCPSCGLTRSWHAALHGHVRESAGFHPLGPASLVLAFAYAAGLDDELASASDPRPRQALIAGTAAAWLITWVVRLRSDASKAA